MDTLAVEGRHKKESEIRNENMEVCLLLIVFTKHMATYVLIVDVSLFFARI